VDHKSKNSHHGGTSVVKLNSTLGGLGLLVEVVPAEVEGSVTEVTNELVLSGNILHDEKLKEANEEDDLKESIGGDGIISEKSGQSVGVGVEGISGGVDVSRDVKSGAGDNLSEEGKLTDTSVLDLNVTEAVETLLAGFVKQAQRIEESNRSLGSDLGLEGADGGGGRAGLGRGEGGGGGDGGGEDDGLHGWIFRVMNRLHEIIAWTTVEV